MDLFGKTFECGCGRTHGIVPREVVYADDALGQLPAVCARVTPGRSAVMLMDVRTRAAAGAAAAEAMSGAGWRVNALLVEDPAPGGSPVCDDHTMEALAPQLGEPDLVVPVGSGVMNDLGKWIAMDRDLPYVAVATAASMNGYASSNIAPTVRGVKRLVYGRAPQAIVAAPAVLLDAPYELTASGLGDVLAKSVSSADWRLNHLLFGDYYCPRSVGLIAEIEPLYLDRPEDVRDGEPEAMEALFASLLLTGVAMTMAETSSPASGGEHLIGH
ncbi:MAG: iron-containing alcohol dehydrogenase, partial [Planctomycetota bacterium]